MTSSDSIVLLAPEALAVSVEEASSQWTTSSLCSATSSADVEALAVSAVLAAVAIVSQHNIAAVTFA